MIELIFGESPAGALKIAKSMKQDDRINCAAMAGGPQEVESLTLALDIGELTEMDTAMEDRAAVLNMLYCDHDDAAKELLQNEHTLGRLREAICSGEKVRIWVCAGDPAEMCALFYICHIMKDSEVPLSVIYVPQQTETENAVVQYRSTGEIPPEAFGKLTMWEEPVSTMKKKAYAAMWHELVMENAPLRAVVNGRVMSVPEDFYDFAIRNQIREGNFVVATLIGQVLRQVPGVGDQWLFQRLQAMIESGELLEVSPPKDDRKYSGVLKKSLIFGRHSS